MAAAWTKRAVRLFTCTLRAQISLPVKSLTTVRRGFCVQASKKVKLLEDSSELLKEQSTTEETEALNHQDYFGVRELVSLKSLFANRAHLGHHKGSRDPYMTPYIFGTRFDYDIIDLEQTLPLFQDALNFVAHVAYRNGIILFVSKNRVIMPDVEKGAREVGEYAHCRHWHAGLFTESSKNFRYVTRLPDVCIFLNTLQNVFETHQAVEDSATLLIPTVGIVDTNCDPRLISYPIPGNDDTIQTQLFYLNLFKEAILIGKKRRADDGLPIEAKEMMEDLDGIVTTNTDADWASINESIDNIDLGNELESSIDDNMYTEHTNADGNMDTEQTIVDEFPNETSK